LGAVLVALAPVSRNHAAVFWTFLVSGLGILAWAAVLFGSAQRSGRPLAIDVDVRKQHWIQACAQGSVLLYWGWHTRVVYPFLPFIVAQLIFAYAFDTLLGLSRRGKHTLGFGPFPIIFSINLFLWFKLDWFHWQFAMVAVGFLAKEMIRWTREGKRVHIFNPSSFPLGVFSLALIATRSWDISFASLIANTQADVPNLYAWIFFISLPGQLLFGVARTTLSAVLTTYLFSILYFKATGTYFFYDSHIPVQVFLGMHLLFTDPSTSPRTELGRWIFGILYGLGVIGLYVVLGWMGAPTLFDKLLPVPILNLLVRRIDAIASSPSLAAIDPSRIGRSLAPKQRNVAYTALWAAVFAALSLTQGVGDRHPGQYLPFWTNACRSGSERACMYTTVLERIYCNDGSGWACNELGVSESRRAQSPAASFRRSCDLGFQPGCVNATSVSAPNALPVRGDPPVTELPIVLRGTKPRLTERDPVRLYAVGCAQGWPKMCAAQTGGSQP
jgi:hypothetical protein